MRVCGRVHDHVSGIMWTVDIITTASGAAVMQTVKRMTVVAVTRFYTPTGCQEAATTLDGLVPVWINVVVKNI